MSLWETIGLGGTKDSSDYFKPESKGYTWGIDGGQTVKRDTDTTWQQSQQDYAAQQAARERQLALAQRLEAQAAGRGPSLANMQLQEALARSNAQSMSMAASASPSQGALAHRAAIQANAQASQQAAGTGAQARIAEQMAAQQQLAQLLGQSRSQDLDARGQSVGQYMGIRQAELGASMGYQDAMAAQANQQAAAYNEEQRKRGELAGQILGAGAKLAMGGF